MTRTRSDLASMAAALLALALLSFASVQSAVMRAAMSPLDDMARVCGPALDGTSSMAGMSMAGSMAPKAQHAQRSTKGRKPSCPFCAAAAHPPIVGQTPPLQFASGFVFAAYRAAASHEARGPPALQPRARGPPAPPLTT